MNSPITAITLTAEQVKAYKDAVVYGMAILLYMQHSAKKPEARTELGEYATKLSELAELLEESRK